MDLKRLELLVDLSRLGSMTEVAYAHHTSTSTVSQHLAALTREAGVPLLEPDGRRVRLTPAGRRLTDHAVRILAEVDAARRALDPDAEPTGSVRVSGFASAIRRTLLPAIATLSTSAPGLHVEMFEFEPAEAFAGLLADSLDLALTYDYQLAPAALPAGLEARALWTRTWGIVVPEADARVTLPELSGRDWIVNSRNDADEIAVRTLAGLAGFSPSITHRIENLDLVCDLVRAGRGVGLMPEDHPIGQGLQVVRLDPAVVMTTYAVLRGGRNQWAPLRAVLTEIGAT